MATQKIFPKFLRKWSQPSDHKVTKHMDITNVPIRKKKKIRNFKVKILNLESTFTIYVNKLRGIKMKHTIFRTFTQKWQVTWEPEQWVPVYVSQCKMFCESISRWSSQAHWCKAGFMENQSLYMRPASQKPS